MLMQWWLNRFKDDEALKTTFSVFCGGGAVLILLALATRLAWEHWVR